MWFREDRGALETPPNSENSREDRRTLQKTPRELKNLSKTANFSISTEAEKWPPFPRLKSRGPIEAGSGARRRELRERHPGSCGPPVHPLEDHPARILPMDQPFHIQDPETFFQAVVIDVGSALQIICRDSWFCWQGSHDLRIILGSLPYVHAFV